MANFELLLDHCLGRLSHLLFEEDEKAYLDSALNKLAKAVKDGQLKVGSNDFESEYFLNKNFGISHNEVTALRNAKMWVPDSVGGYQLLIKPPQPIKPEKPQKSERSLSLLNLAKPTKPAAIDRIGAHDPSKPLQSTELLSNAPQQLPKPAAYDFETKETLNKFLLALQKRIFDFDEVGSPSSMLARAHFKPNEIDTLKKLHFFKRGEDGFYLDRSRIIDILTKFKGKK